MRVYLREVASGNNRGAIILPAEKKDMPLKKKGWQFFWKSLYKIEGAYFYKICLTQTPAQIEGMLMLTLINDEMLFMNNIEVAPKNYGANGIYDNVAGCILAFACMKSFELGKGHYVGFLAFESKTSLINLYQERYGATHAMGQKMFFDPKAGRGLMAKYLKIDHLN